MEQKEVTGEINEKEVQKEAVNAILEEPVPFEINVAKHNILHRLKVLPKKQKFTIYPIKLAPLGKISQILLDMGLPENIEKLSDSEVWDVTLRNIVENKDKILTIVAYAITNTSDKPSNKLIRFLDKNLTTSELYLLFVIVLYKMGTSHFFLSMKLMKRMNILPTKKQ